MKHTYEGTPFTSADEERRYWAQEIARRITELFRGGSR